MDCRNVCVERQHRLSELNQHTTAERILTGHTSERNEFGTNIVGWLVAQVPRRSADDETQHIRSWSWSSRTIWPARFAAGATNVFRRRCGSTKSMVDTHEERSMRGDTTSMPWGRPHRLQHRSTSLDRARQYSHPSAGPNTSTSPLQTQLISRPSPTTVRSRSRRLQPAHVPATTSDRGHCVRNAHAMRTH